jgi:hypothetical protein
VGKLQNRGTVANRTYFADQLESDVTGTVSAVTALPDGRTQLQISSVVPFFISEYNNPLRYNPRKHAAVPKSAVFDSTLVIKTYTIPAGNAVLVKPGETVQPAQPIANWQRTNDMFYTDMARIYLLVLFVFLCSLVYIAYRRRKAAGRYDDGEAAAAADL